jgi:hypothetical protein
LFFCGLLGAGNDTLYPFYSPLSIMVNGSRPEFHCDMPELAGVTNWVGTEPGTNERNVFDIIAA